MIFVSGDDSVFLKPLMKKVGTIIFLILLLFLNALYAQERIQNQDHSPHKRFNIGIGTGIDYGGFGCRLTFRPEKHLGIFGAAGYNLVDFTYNVGADYRFFPEKKATLALGAMYGYNGLIHVRGAEKYNKTYYGPSVSLGIELNSTKRPGNYFNFEILYPFRSQSFKDAWKEVEDDPEIEDPNKPFTLAFSLGYHFRF